MHYCNCKPPTVENTMNFSPRNIAIVLSAMLIFVALSGLATENIQGPVDFTLPKLGGGETSLSDYRGQWVVVNYWATWCAPCRKEMPELSQLHDDLEHVTVLGLAFEENHDSSFETYVRLAGVSYPVLKVNIDHPPEPFGTPKVLPTTILINREGWPIKILMGPVSRTQLEFYINGEAEKPRHPEEMPSFEK